MAKVRLSDGRVLNFSGTPTHEDIEEAVSQIGEIKKPTPTKGLLEKITTPLVSQERIEKSPTGQFLMKSMPFTQFKGAMLPPPLSSFLPPQVKERGVAELVSEQTSPLAIGSNLLLLKGLRTGGFLPKTGIEKKLPQIMGKDYTLERAKTLARDLKDLRKGYGSLKEDMLTKVGHLQTKPSSVYKILADLPDAVMAKFEDPIYNIERSAKGAFKTNIQNIDKMREAIGDLLSSRDWIEATKTNKSALRHIFNELGKVMKRTSPEVTSSLDAYSNFMKNIYRPAEKTLFRSGQIVEKPLRGAVKAGAERTTQQAIEGLAKSVSTSKQALKDMMKFTGRQNLKNILFKTALYGGGGGGILYGLRRISSNR